MFGKKRDDNGEKLYRYSIRKYHFGAASVAIAALIFFANGVAKADMPSLLQQPILKKWGLLLLV